VHAELFDDPRFATREGRIANPERLIELLPGRVSRRPWRTPAAGVRRR
jgi:hypothetical protein